MITKLKSSHFPTPKDKLILIDLDKTLISSNYQLTNNLIFSTIKRVIDSGWQVGISSDTPLASPLEWRKKIGMNGPLIAEREALVWIPTGSGGKKINLVPKSQDFFHFLRKKLIEKLEEERISFFVGDTVTAIKNNFKLKDTIDKKLILINAYRECNLGFWAKSIVNGNLAIDNTLAKEITEYLSVFLKEAPFQITTDFNEDYGICIISPKLATKRNATRKLMKYLKFSKIAIIGDSTTDYVGKKWPSIMQWTTLAQIFPKNLIIYQN